VTRRLLVLTHPNYALGIPLPQAIENLAPTMKAEEADPTPLTIEKLAKSGYDAVVCWADREEELEIVVRIRKHKPKIPIMLVTTDNQLAFRAAAFEKGATSLLPATRNVASLVNLLEQAVELRLAANESRTIASQGRELTRELRELTKQTLALGKESRRRLEQSQRPAPLPLLICDDPEQAFGMVRAFEKAEMFSPLPILRSSDEAIAYFEGRPPYDNRTRYPIPTLALLDLHLNGMTGLELLSWIRLRDELKNLPIIMLSASVNAEDIKRAYGVQANSYLIKPGNFDELVEMVKAIGLYWSSMNINPEP